ncbi:uncharacterized protein LOC124137463 [Haliotis rufescens]|uniref:uncharacterized protein LOC124137463 n=1 Tax=Haliotis rufescens TaxID=6454 RepID=UPI00201EFAA1|nr:uncharacterized protein LOC124137463 [Haliotis rufescens]
MKMKSEYEIYRSQTDPFWSDIPHEKSTMASKKRKAKRNALYLMKARPSLRDVNISPPARKKRMKTFIRHKKCLSKEDFRVVLPFGHVEDEISATTSHERISLFVKSRTTYRIFLHGKLNMIQLKEAIEYKDNIPAHLQMLTHHGKLIRPSTLKNLQPDDTIHVIVRSKGGMKGAATKLSVVKKGAGLPNSATEDEVQEWLLSVIKVPRLLIKDEVKLVDGEMLNEYMKASDINEELGLPMGFCRKILYLNENHTGDRISGMSKESLESFTPDHICGVAKETFKDDKHLDQILQAIRNEHIDGFVAMLYENPETLATDLNIKKVLGRKLLICIKRALKEFTKDTIGTKNVKGRTDIETEIKTAPEHDISTEPTAQLVSKTTSEHTSELSPGAPKKPADASQHLESPSIAFLRKHLGLDIEQTNDVRQKSDHQLIAIHSSWEPSHQLARMFLFWVLCKGDQFDKSCDRKELWKVIVQSTSTWLQTLPEVLQSDFVEGKGENQFQFKGQKSVRLCPVGEKVIKYEHLTPKQRDQYKYHILILHEDIIDTKDQVYKIFDGRCCLTASVKEVTNKMYCIDKTITNVTTLTLNTPTKSLSHTQKSREAFSEGGEKDNEFDLTYHGEMKERYGKTHTFSQKPTINDLKTAIQFQRPRPFKQDCLSTVYFQRLCNRYS